MLLENISCTNRQAGILGSRYTRKCSITDYGGAGNDVS